MTPDEKKTLQDILYRLNRLEHPDRYVFEKNIQMTDGRSIQLGTTTGLKIGTTTTEKLGFYGATPVVRQSAITTPSGGSIDATNATDISARTAIGQIKTILANLGLTA